MSSLPAESPGFGSWVPKAPSEADPASISCRSEDIVIDIDLDNATAESTANNTLGAKKAYKIPQLRSLSLCDDLPGDDGQCHACHAVDDPRSMKRVLPCQVGPRDLQIKYNLLPR